MGLRELYEQVSTLLSLLDFDTLWPGFSRTPFALYDEQTVVLQDEEIPWDRRFLGNTAIPWKSGFLAIWKPQAGEQTDELAADLVHEMFHAFQMARGETRYPQDLSMLAYPTDAGNLSMKLEENRLLAESFDFTPAEQITALAALTALRRLRKEKIGIFLEGELFSETAEGMAEYFGMLALQQISVKKFDNRLFLSRTRLLDGTWLFDPRRGTYDSGLLILLACSRCGVGFIHEVGQETRPVFELIAAQFPEAVVPTVRENVDERAAAFFRDKQERINTFFKEAVSRTEGNFRIIGYDPMNMERSENRILCSHFIILEESGESRFIEGPVGLLLCRGFDNRVTAYYTK